MKRTSLAFEEEDEEDEEPEEEKPTKGPEEDPDEEEDDEKVVVPKNSMLFSRQTVVNNIKSKIEKSSKKTNTVSADSLIDRLNLIKNWR